MNRHRPILLLAILASLVVLLAACSSESASGTESASATEAPAAESTPTAAPDAASEEPAAGGPEVRIVNSVFQPGELTVSVGDEVVFTNEDTFTHTITEGTDGDAVEDPIVDEEISGRGEVRVTFDEAGTYDITCEIHPTMQVTITVEG